MTSKGSAPDSPQTLLDHGPRPGRLLHGPVAWWLPGGAAAHAHQCHREARQRYQRARHRPEGDAGHDAAADIAEALQRPNHPGDDEQRADGDEQAVLHGAWPLGYWRAEPSWLDAVMAGTATGHRWFSRESRESGSARNPKVARRV